MCKAVVTSCPSISAAMLGRLRPAVGRGGHELLYSMPDARTPSYLRITQAYASLFLAPTRRDGSRTAPIAALGVYEVRLVEMTAVEPADQSVLWVELYARDVQATIDSCRCVDLEEAFGAAERFIEHATRLVDAAGHDGG